MPSSQDQVSKAEGQASVPKLRDDFLGWAEEEAKFFENRKEKRALKRKTEIALLNAVQESNLEKVAELLIEAETNGVGVNFPNPRDAEDERQCLDLAIDSNNEKLACMLVKAGATLPCSSSSIGRWDTYMYKAIEQNMHETVDLLMEKESKGVESSSNHAQKNKTEALLHVVRGRRNIAVAQLLLAHGAETNWKDLNEHNVLLSAVEAKDYKMVDLLLQHDADIDARKRDGSTVLDVALKHKDGEIMNLLLQKFSTAHGVETTTDMRLDLALEAEDFETALVLLEEGVETILRFQANAYSKGVESIVGPKNEYPKALCKEVVSLKDWAMKKDLQQFERTDSDAHFSFAAKALLECITHHSNCILAETGLPQLPSRVLDLIASGGIKLVESSSSKGRYVALSHRWGSSEITKTTKANLQSRLDCITFEDLTRTMQDAVTITRRLGIRYLWIDAMCIIQDSHSDWSDQAGNMSSVYRNAFFTISAAAAADHSEGCFATVKKASGGDLNSRGWVLQEQLLSPRILEYGFGIIRWECISQSQNSDQELFQENKPRRYSDNTKNLEAIHFKRALYGFRSTSMSLEQQAYLSWQNIVASYSKRILTKDSDKLMAVLGIANFLGKTLKDEFVAGLWKGHLYRDLLWTSAGIAKARIKAVEFPTWSWASLSGPVSYSQWPAGSTPTYLKSMIDVLQTSSSALAGEKPEGKDTLTLKGMLQYVVRGKGYDSHRLIPRRYQVPKHEEMPPETVKRQKRGSFQWLSNIFGRRREKASTPEDGSSNRFDTSRLDLKDYDALERTEPFVGKMQNVSAHYTPDIASEDLQEAWVMPVASEYFWIHCLVLVEKKDEQGKRFFRRIGRCYLDALKKAQFFITSENEEIVLV